MSGIVNKIKDALHHDSSSTSTTHGTTSTTHGTNNPNSHVSSATAGSTNHGGHNSNLANKADPRIDSDRDGSKIPGAAGHSGVSNTHSSGLTSGSTNHGPHDSNLANKADPRVDSDRDGSNRHTTGTTGYGSNTTGHSTTGNTGYGSNTHGSTNAGPHDSNIANKLDPRVDSDRDGSNRHTGTTGYGSNTTGHSTTHNTGYGSSNTHGSTNAGPHDSNVANKLDPRVDSDRDGSNRHTGTTGTTGTGYGSNTHGSNTHGSNTYGSTNNGPHNSNMANAADPRVDSDHSKTGPGHSQTGGVFGASGSHATSGSGTAQNTSGPHNSDLLNKLDPRVDSDKDGSKTFGGNKTHA